MIKKLILISVAVYVASFGIVFAQQVPFDQNDYVYVLHLYYDNGQLVFNRDSNLKYEVSLGQFITEQTTVNSYVGELISSTAEVVLKFNFDPTKGNPNFRKGVVDVQAPYRADVSSINLYNSSNKLLLAVDTSDTLICNDNSICEATNGEDSNTCPKDCKSPLVSVIPTPVLPIADDGLGLTTIILYIVGGLAVAGLAIWGIMKWKRKKANNISITTP